MATESRVPRSQVAAGMGRAGAVLGDEAYLWMLVLLEALAIGWLRSAFRKAHGG